MEQEAGVWYNKEKSFIENFLKNAKCWPEVSFRKVIHLIIIAVTMSFSYRSGKLSISLGTRLQIRLQLGNDIHSSKLNLIPAWLCNVVGGAGKARRKRERDYGVRGPYNACVWTWSTWGTSRNIVGAHLVPFILKFREWNCLHQNLSSIRGFFCHNPHLC